MASKTGRSRTSVRKVIKAERDQHPTSVLTEKEIRPLIRTAAAGDQFAAELKAKLGLKASVRTIQRVLQRVDNLVYTKMDRTLPLTVAHKIHASRETTHFLKDLEVETMARPDRSSDCNPIENVWSVHGSQGVSRPPVLHDGPTTRYYSSRMGRH
ncbi:Hypothetical protein PHPALM_8832 [Phytophthora palmivora]|uniref:Transposase Tc1-like domain-containing protein n=1 Tax=Phytophthora palmivora TaxID=4796 RepID=A0A2P4Y8W1_9STRA|nr:Hypothetical protein PHPALM_8832 [Phytophthora palmivora]